MMNDKELPEDPSIRLLGLTKRYIKGLTERLLEITALYGLSKRLNLATNLDEALGETERLLKKYLDIDDFCIFLLDKSGETLILSQANDETLAAAHDVTFKIGEGICGLAAKNGKTMLVQDVSKEKRFLYYKGRRKNIGSFLAIPLKSGNGKVIGIFNIHKAEANGFKDNDVLVYSASAVHIAEAVEKTKILKESKQQAITDSLTQLYSRRYFMNAMERELSNAERYGGTCSFLLIDVDHFKDINDDFGHQAGDKMLKRLGDLFKTYTRKGDLVARYGGEEFAVLMAGVGLKDAAALAEKLRAMSEQYLKVEEEGKPTRTVTISVGVSAYPETGANVEQIINYADKALYYAKDSGRNIVCAETEGQTYAFEEKRRDKRFNVGLKRVYRGQETIWYIDINANGKWMPCVIEDISLMGFKGVVDFAPNPEEVYRCKAVSKSNMDSPDFFPVRCVNNGRMHNQKHGIGVEIVGNFEQWKKCFRMITR
ncbi:MAG: diguanylate cyclase [Nitrospinota bacterium]